MQARLKWSNETGHLVKDVKWSIKRLEAEIASFKNAALGLNTIEKRSGTSEYRKPRLSKSGSTHYRQALYFPAMAASRKNPDVQALHQRLVEGGNPKMCALGLLCARATLAAMVDGPHYCQKIAKWRK